MKLLLYVSKIQVGNVKRLDLLCSESYLNDAYSTLDIGNVLDTIKA